MNVTYELRPALRLFTADQRTALVENGARHRAGRQLAPLPPVVLGACWSYPLDRSAR